MGFHKSKEKKKITKDYVYGNMHRLLFLKTWRVKVPLELVHIDICRLIWNPSFGNKRYFILLIDDYTKITWFYSFDEKSYVSFTFLQFKALEKNQSEREKKTLWTHWGEEIIDQHFLTIARKKEFIGNSWSNTHLKKMASQKWRIKQFKKWQEACYKQCYLHS